jgi:hypothetical protein
MKYGRPYFVFFFRPHCDGNCDNSPHVSTGRVATAVLYCQVNLCFCCGFVTTEFYSTFLQR